MLGWQVCCGRRGNVAVESAASLLWNQWQVWRGIGGNFHMELVATFARNTHPHEGPLQAPRREALPDPVETERALQQLRAAGFSDDQQTALTTALLRVLALWTQQA